MADEVNQEPKSEEVSLLDRLKQHIELEDNMDSDILPFYMAAAERYVIKKIGYNQNYLQIMIATVMYDNRSASDDLRDGLAALEPIFSLEVLTNGSDYETTADQSAEMESNAPSAD